MKILSLDVSGNYSSIALLDGDEINTFTKTHERKDRPEWNDLFASINFDSSIDFETLDALAFARGPGSYTALRITASFLKGIAVVKNLPLIPISNLHALAYEASQWIDAPDASILVTLEADQNESYFASYIKSPDGIAPLKEESVIAVSELEVLAQTKSPRSFIAGTGWSQSTQEQDNFLSEVLTSAESIAALAKIELLSGKSFDLESANPVYLKTPHYDKK